MRVDGNGVSGGPARLASSSRGWGAGTSRVIAAAAVLAIAFGGLCIRPAPARADVTQFVLPGLAPPGLVPDGGPIAAGTSGVWWWNNLELLNLSPQGRGSVAVTQATVVPNELALEPGGDALVGLDGEPGGLERVAPSGPVEAIPLPESLVAQIKSENQRVGPVSFGGRLTGSTNGTTWFYLNDYYGHVPVVVERSAAGGFTAVSLRGGVAGENLVAASDGTLWLLQNTRGPEGALGVLHVSGPEAYVFYPTDVGASVEQSAAGPSGEVDVTEGNRVVSVSESGSKTEYTLPPWTYEAQNIAVGPDGTIWLLAKLLPAYETRWHCSGCIPLVKLMPSGGYSAYWLGGLETSTLGLPNGYPSTVNFNLRALQGVVVDHAGNAWVAASVGGAPSVGGGEGYVRELIRVPPATAPSWPPSKPAAMGPAAPPKHSVIHGIDIAAEVRELNHLKATARELDTASTALDVLKVAIAGAAIVSAPELSIALLEPDLTESAAEFVSGVANQAVIEDPPDRHYRRVTGLARLHVSAVRAGHGVSRAAATAWNALIDDELRYTVAVRALVAAAQRAEGAAQARSCSWLARQNQAARSYAMLAAHALAATGRLAARLRAVLARSPLGRVNISAAALGQAAQQIAAHGLPAAASRALSQLGVSAATKARLAAEVATLKPKSVSLLGVLTETPSGRGQTSAALAGLARAAARARCPRTHHPRKR